MEEKVSGSIGVEKSQYGIWRTWGLGFNTTSLWFINTHAQSLATIDSLTWLPLLKASGALGTNRAWNVTALCIQCGIIQNQRLGQGHDIQKQWVRFGQKAGFEMNTNTLAEGSCGMWLHLVERRWPPRLGTWLSAFWWASVPGSSTGGDEPFLRV